MNFLKLPAAWLVRVSGTDAPRYLNSRLAANIRDLSDQQSVLSGMLSAQGKTQALFSVGRLKDAFFLSVTAGSRAEIVQHLLQFRVADRVELEELPHLGLHFAEIDQAILEQLLWPGVDATRVIEHDGVILVPRTRLSSSGVDVFASQERLRATFEQCAALGIGEMSEQQFCVERVRHHRPDFPFDIHEGTLFLESGLTEAISFRKGCYVGQEVMEKVDSHGRLPFSLLGLRAEGRHELAAGTAVLNQSGKQAGTVQSFAFSPLENMTLCFARLRSAEQSSEVFTIDGRDFFVLGAASAAVK